MTISITRPALDVGLATNNEKEMLAFYCDFLGLSVTEKLTFPNVGVLHKIAVGNSIIKLLIRDKQLTETPNNIHYSDSIGIRWFCLEVDDLAGLVQRSKDAGYNVPMDLVELRPGVKAAMIEDPDKNTIEFFEIKKS